MLEYENSQGSDNGFNSHALMRRGARTLTRSFILLFLIAASGSAATAKDPVPQDALASWATNVELRLRLTDRYVNGTYYIWKLRPGGAATGVGHTSVDQLSLRGGFLLEENDIGRWRQKDGLLCMTWPKYFYGKEHCYKVELFGDNKARFTSVGGGQSFTADWGKIPGIRPRPLSDAGAQ